MYDYLIVGAGLFGAVFAHEAKTWKILPCCRKAKSSSQEIFTVKCRRNPCPPVWCPYFHTSDRKIWDYINQFSEFNNYINSPVAIYKDELYNLPFNMNTFSKMEWNIQTPAQAKAKIAEQIADLGITEPKNLEEQALSLVGTDVYEKLIKGYTEKQWGRSCRELPSFIIRRLPLRFTYDNNYFNSRYQGIPVEGYTAIVEKMLSGADIRLNTDYFAHKEELSALAHKTVFTGMLDEYFGFCYGSLEYRSVRFEEERLECDNYQGNAVVNYTDREVPYTRIIEHKHFTFGTQPFHLQRIFFEWKPGIEPYYPINDAKNSSGSQISGTGCKGRACDFWRKTCNYKYYDMDQVIAAALDCADAELS